MDTGLAADNFYVNAQEIIRAQSYDQDLEDEIDLLMRTESDLLEESEIDAVLDEEDAVQMDLQTEVTPSEFTEFAIKIPVGGEIVPFSFDGRRYLRPIYDSPARGILMKCARQTEKCDCEDEKVLTPSGAWITVGDMEIGDEIISLEALSPEEERDGLEVGACRFMATSWRFDRDRVVDKKCVGKHEAVKLTSRMGSEIIVSSATPLLLASGWRRADEVQVGDRVAAARTIKDVARFGNGWGGEAFSELYGILLADGGLSSRNPTITKFDPEEFQHIVDLLEEVGNPYTAYPKSSNKKPFIRLLVGPVVDSLDIDGLIGQTSGGKFIPRWVFEESTWEETLAFLRGLWRCDGSVRHRDGQHDLWDVVYASTSERLAQQVRELLLKIGIPSRIRPNNHAAYRDDPYKDQYLVRVETIEGVRHFLELVWGDHETASTLREFGDSNRDTYPKELVTPLIKEVCASLGLGLRRGRGHKSILKERGLRVTPLHPLSRAKLKRYVDLFDDLGALCPEHDQLKQMLNGDVIWDEIVSTESLGEQNVYHIEVERNHNYLHDGLVTHNSTLLGNKSIAYSGINLAFKTLYVSSTATQAQVFSVDRIKEPIDISPELSFMLDSRLSQNVLFKQFKNRSQIRIRYAYLNADRTRGIPADHILIDEIQDIIYENIPVIEQCASHSPWRLLTYSGTPKTLDNTIELFWNKFSTQNEWVVPCEACGSAKDKSTWHWNVLGMKNIGKDYLVCARCKRQINPMHPDAQWASLNPVTAENVHKVTFEGYRIPQLMVPWVLWSDIIMNLERYDTARFHNEVLGLSYDSGTRPLTRAQIKACCREDIHFNEVIENASKCTDVFAGLDWGTGEATSFTVLSLGGYMPDIGFTIFFTHRFIGEDLEPRLQLEKIARLLTRVNFKVCGADYGGGFDRNDWLMRNFGPMKLVKYQYSANPKYKVKWQPALARFILHRTEIMSDIFNAIKYRRFTLPNWEEFRTPHGDDMLNIFSEYNRQLKMIQYQNSPGKADDTFHSILYCVLASMLIKPRPDIIVPLREGSVNFNMGMAA